MTRYQFSPRFFYIIVAFNIAVRAPDDTLGGSQWPELTAQREKEISQNVTARLLTEGTFLHPTDQVTFYTRLIDEDGVLRDVFLSDRRNATRGVIYTAAEAYLVRNGEATTLIMVDGLAQRLNQETKRLATAKFRDFSFDISALVSKSAGRQISTPNLTTPAFLTSWDQLSRDSGDSMGTIAEEFHSRFAQPLFCVVAAMVGFSTLLLGGFSRFGVWREVVIAFGLLIAIDGFRGALVDEVLTDPTNWPLMYMPVLVGAILVVAMLSVASRPGLLRRRRPGAAA